MLDVHEATTSVEKRAPSEEFGPPPSTPPASPGRATAVFQRAFTALLVIGPVVALTFALVLWRHHLTLLDITLAVVLYSISGHGVTIGYHRLFTHRSFTAKRPLKIALALAGSLAVEGSLVGWVANHRRHHMFSDRAGDPHSPHRYGPGAWGQLRGLAYAHVGWLFAAEPTSAERFAPDLQRDRDVKLIDKLFPALAVASFALPFAAGWLLTRSITGALSALLWAGVVRVALLHHATWSVNSVCHMFGRQPLAVSDHSANFAPLAVLSMGESWHNYHHAHPSSARHGAGRGQLDSSAAMIRMFEKAGWATKVHWPPRP
ncbi:MAG: acyl-CoA desaturase [Actinomycetia bacterium]|nr:acyl-CoA desaturase [Actinomycetes bacterium]